MDACVLHTTLDLRIRTVPLSRNSKENQPNNDVAPDRPPRQNSSPGGINNIEGRVDLV